ncbi:MAG: glycosyltransferase family 2 protein [Bacteriovoracia bacterium]
MMHSIVMPVYNEKEGLPTLYKRLTPLLDKFEKDFESKVEVVLVNDGSRDGSEQVLDEIAKQDSRYRIVHLSRNFGHQIALTAGMEWASGQTLTVMDADLQDPPELIEQMLNKWKEGFDVVYAVREKREGETFFKLATAKLFYKIIRKLTNVDIPADTGDFRLMDRKVVDALVRMKERNRFLRGMVVWVGFKQIGLTYRRDAREFGETHYPFRKMLRFAIDGVTSFSVFPLQMATYIGVATAFCSFLGILYTFYLHLAHKTVHGWSSLMVVILFLGGLQLLALGIVGEYLGRALDEVRGRPLYFVGRTVGFRGRPQKENAPQTEVYEAL